MTPDDAHTSHNHGFELPDTPVVVVQKPSRPWRAVAGVALCLGLAGIVTGLVVAHRQRNSDARITSDALQREELREGWKALGAAAVQDARSNDLAPSPTANTAAVPNVVIVNVPAQSAAAAPPNAQPSNVTNINLPSGTGANGTPLATPLASPNPNTGTAPIQSMPPIAFSPVPGYLPPPGAYAPPPTSGTPPLGYSPPIVYGTNPTNPSGAAPYTPPIGNGSIPGSTPNPAFPNNNGLVGSTPTPGLPNGSVNGGIPQSPPTGAPTSPGTTSLPSGFSAP
jgi:hypothetical protein